ncbi:hypothetical protein M0812_09697 [Anaeramoeba flamelloides]|uniref:BTB domain-containing protein n=1 Tax=Anaeramoeba flamelloides TaxID=1746091 RepID=A0AAV7ZTN9_9EUKA|nr:hypothetical protein M0812_09697 [Anaeramoeba flamelloides]
MTESSIFVSGKPSYATFLVDSNQSKLPQWSPINTSVIENQTEVKKIVAGSSSNKSCLIWRGTNQLEFYKEDIKHKYKIENEEIKDIQSGYSTFLILTVSGKIYSLADRYKCSHCEIPLTDLSQSNWKQVVPVPFFNEKENDRLVESFAMVGWSNYFVCKNGDFYANGYNLGRLGDGTKNNHKSLPVLIKKNVTRVFGGVQAYHFFLTTKSNELYAAGSNYSSVCGLSSDELNLQMSPKKVDDWKASDILDIFCFSSSVLITKEGKAYGCGSVTSGCGKVETRFKEIPLLKDKKVVKISGGYATVCVLTSENELYGWNFNTNNQPTEQYQNNKEVWNKPRKINVPEYFIKNSLPLNFSFGTENIFLYQDLDVSTLKQDFKKFYESKKYCDSKLIASGNEEIPIHKIIVELRTNLKIEEINEIFLKNTFSLEEINTFLQWAYFGTILDTVLITKFFDSLNLPFPPKSTFEQDLLKLYKDEDSKDFTLQVKMEDDDDDYDDDDDDDFEEIPVHKLILVARSGLFRELFQNLSLNENAKNTNSVQDYSNKTIESLEIFVKYLYTSKIELTADDDPQLIVEELEDSIEYYQLNKNSNLKNELNKIKRQFDLN